MKYPGGKRKCFQRLINIMPQHHTYIETHPSGGAVMRNKLPADRNIGIELDINIVQRWRDEEDNVCERVHTDAVSFLRNYKFKR